MPTVSGQIRFPDGNHADVELEIEPLVGTISKITTIVIVECIEKIRPSVLKLTGKMINLDKNLDNPVIHCPPSEYKQNVDFFISADNRSP